MDDRTEWFQPTSGRIVGVLAVVAALTALGFAVADLRSGANVSIALGALLAATLSWAALLRPRLGTTDSTLVLRNMLETVRLPLAAIDDLAVGQVLAVRAGGRRFVSPAVGKTLRASLRGSSHDLRSALAPEPVAAATISYPDFVVQRIQQKMTDARRAAGVEPGSDEQQALAAQVERRPAVPEIGVITTSGLALVASLLL